MLRALIQPLLQMAARKLMPILLDRLSRLVNDVSGVDMRVFILTLN